MPKISPLSLVDPKAVLADDVEVGPFCVVGPDVCSGRGASCSAMSSIAGHTTVGRNNVFHPNSVIGGDPQDKKYRGSPTRLEIGNDNIFREAVTIHIGTEKGGGVTRLGNNNLLMVNTPHRPRRPDRQQLHPRQQRHDRRPRRHRRQRQHDGRRRRPPLRHHRRLRLSSAATPASTTTCRRSARSTAADQVRGVNKVGLRRGGVHRRRHRRAGAGVPAAVLRRRSRWPWRWRSSTLQNGINPQVRKMVEFLRRRDMGRHGRYLESIRTNEYTQPPK